MVLRHSKHVHSKKVVSAVMAGLIAFGGGASIVSADEEAANATTANASQTAINAFSDVNAGYWGEKYIYQLAAQGIVTGNNGKFRPNDPVTQQEAVTMAIRFLSMQDQLSSGAATLPTNIKVNDYFTKYVELAFQQNLLDKQKESGYTDEKVIWGAQKASREWITEVLVRSIGRTAEADAAKNKATGFADNAKISPDRLGYVNVAVELGLAKGLNGNKFDPQGAVTRAQLATFLSRAQAYITTNYENQYKGSIASIENGKLELYADGKLNSFKLDNSTAYFTSDSEKRLQFSEINPYTQAVVIVNNGTAAYVEITDSTQQVERFDRTYARLSPNNVIWLDTGSTFEELSYEPSTVFLDQNGTKIDPKTLAAGSLLTIERETYSPQKKIVSIRVKSGLVNKTGAGVVQNVDTVNKRVTLKDSTGYEDTYTWDDATVIRYQNQILAPAELKNGYTVNFTVENSVLQTLEVTQSVDRSVQAMLYSIEENGKTITYKRSGSTQLETKYLAEKPEIMINGVAKPVLSDLLADAVSGDQVTLTINGEEKISKIEVTGRQIEQLDAVTVVNYDGKTHWLTVKDANNQPRVIVLDDKTKLDSSYGTTLDKVGPLLVSGRKVSVSLIGTRVLSLEVVYKVEGKINSINTSKQVISIMTANGKVEEISYYNSPIVEIFGRSGASLADLRIGDEVLAQLSNNQDYLQSLKLKTSAQFEVVSTEPTRNRIRVKANGSTSDIYTDKSILTGETGQAILLADLRPGALVNITFQGLTPVAVAEVKLTLGEVTSVDASANALTMKDYSGNSQTLGVSGGVKVVKNGSTASNLSALTSGDRVEIRKDIQGVTIIQVLEKVERAFWQASSTEIQVKRKSINDNFRYVLSDKVFVHQGDTTLSVQSLKENDNIVLYLNNGVVVEIVKQ
ncbi:S-layer homology domain-containing protein [Paenibacillus sp. p3-SID867]|uniref:S-layer homology domain-containing protein n=1 Tax=Paenibacillus sp. p3-SID867 TaxID=2916363 RepID=UPI0021A7CAD5|nr:S-layer homology domain-containing protein [Paenibacillus sp. p3-SID867]MCT1403343.1 S-layer homology domain-containing protein [Paenibacillus sp. p3-SID867]